MRFTDWWVDGGLSERSEAWYALARHPFFADCYNKGGTLIDAMIAKLDAQSNLAESAPVEPYIWDQAALDRVFPDLKIEKGSAA